MPAIKITITRNANTTRTASRVVMLQGDAWVVGNDLPGQEVGAGQFLNLTILQKAKIATRINAVRAVLDDLTEKVSFEFITVHYGALTVTVED